jgi:arylsulfatase A-like enzyme
LTDELTDMAISFIDGEARRAEPFWLSLNYTAPHYPWIDAHPKEYTHLYADCPFTSCPVEPPHPFSAGGNPATDEGHSNRRESLIGYFAATTAMDAGIGRVLDALEAAGLLESTLVIFMSDNGMNCGHHGIWGKGNGTRPQNMYDTSVKVPCIFSQPSRIPEGHVSDRLTSAYDVFPTLLEYLGLDAQVGAHRPGHSFAPVLRGEVGSEDSAIVVYDEYGPVRMVRTRDWKYVHRAPHGPHELFDLRNDPDERSNRVDDHTCDDQVATLRAQLDRWFATFVDPAVDGTKLNVTGAGQLAHAVSGRAAFATVPIAALSKEK